jgi:hypothetical protein
MTILNLLFFLLSLFIYAFLVVPMLCVCEVLDAVDGVMA